MRTFEVDIDKIRDLAKEIGTDGRRFKEVFGNVKNNVEEKYGISLSEHLYRLARDMYHAVTPDVPYVLEFIVSELIDNAGQEYGSVIILNPKGIYNLCCGLGRSAVASSGYRLAEVIVNGDVGSFYGGYSANRYFFHHIKGNAGRSFMDNAQQGNVILEGVADDSAAQVNHGANFLFKRYVGPRLAWGQRGGNIITLENLPFNAGLFMAGGNIITLGDKIEGELGPDMQEGRIYTPKISSNTLGIGTFFTGMEIEDYTRIADALYPFLKELGIEEENLHEHFNSGKTTLRINGEKYDFSKYYKIMPQRLKNS